MLYKLLRRDLGNEAENLACDYLQGQGLSLLMRNFSCRLGEIDLIMWDETTVVFVEVRSRSQNDGYAPIDSIGFSKQQRLLRTGLFFLQKKGWLERYSCRFDVIGITYTLGQPDVRWLKHALSF